MHESQYIKSVACTNMHNRSLRMHMHVTMFVSQIGLLYATYMYNPSGMCKCTVYLSVCENLPLR